jgi:dTDP-4-dehydrorhamnose reductase
MKPKQKKYICTECSSIYYKLKNKQPVQLFFDVFYTPILIEKLVEIIDKLVALNSYGIFNIVSDDRISKFNFGIILANVFGFDQSLISPVSNLFVRSLDFKAL